MGRAIHRIVPQLQLRPADGTSINYRPPNTTDKLYASSRFPVSVNYSLPSTSRMPGALQSLAATQAGRWRYCRYVNACRSRAAEKQGRHFCLPYRGRAWRPVATWGKNQCKPKSRSLVRNDIDMSFRPRLRSPRPISGQAGQDVPRDDMLGWGLHYRGQASSGAWPHCQSTTYSPNGL